VVYDADGKIECGENSDVIYVTTGEEKVPIVRVVPREAMEEVLSLCMFGLDGAAIPIPPEDYCIYLQPVRTERLQVRESIVVRPSGMLRSVSGSSWIADGDLVILVFDFAEGDLLRSAYSLYRFEKGKLDGVSHTIR